MDHDYKEHLSDPPPQDTGIDQLLEENNRQEKEDPLPDDFSVKSPADLIVCPAPRPGVINLCEYDYTIGAPLDPTPVGHFLPMADLLAFCQEWAKHHGMKSIKKKNNFFDQFHPDEIHQYSPLAHAAHKRVTLEQVIAIQKLSQSNIKPTQILLQLQTSNNKTYATNKTISNVLQKQRLKDLDGRTPIQALLDILKESNWTYDVKDCALRDALAEVFPDLQHNLCTGHLTQNIVTNCQKYFGTDNNDSDSDVTDFKERNDKKKQQKKATDKEEDKTTNPWKAFLPVRGKVANLKNPELYVTHFKELKAHLATRPAVFEYIETSMVPSSALAVDNQINHVHESICRDTMKTLVNVPNLVVPLLGKISTFAIKECLCQFKRLVDLDPTEPCSHTVTIGLGIPCAHHIMELMEDDKFVAPKDFHYQWHFREPKKKSTWTSCYDSGAPSQKEYKGRPTTKAERLTSTKRQPSAFEIIKANLKKEQLAHKQASKARRGKKSKPIKKNKPTETPKIDSEDASALGLSSMTLIFHSWTPPCHRQVMKKRRKRKSKKKKKEASKQEKKENNHCEEENEQENNHCEGENEQSGEEDDKKHKKKDETDSQTNDTAANHNQSEETIVQEGGVTLLTKGR
ncbi:hypothetical protein PSTT_03934 [Puccinia striiformis]|uniref:MULE transposase domain-containing protein n=2 Tax=Puccinia striiformis TaxID=27350 RepID=A0A2S4VUG9_9BASI|nr:hypothetical protein PSTT_03934 [Puccinia striiformis]